MSQPVTAASWVGLVRPDIPAKAMQVIYLGSVTTSVEEWGKTGTRMGDIW